MSPEAGPYRCAACGGSAGKTHEATERMFGLGGRFFYFECAGCGLLQLTNPPGDFSPYYPPTYYSYRAVVSHKGGGLRRWVRKQRLRAPLLGQGGLWRLIAKRPNAHVERLRELLARTGVVSFRDRILDVGCGKGELLHKLYDAGFERLTGVDPFLPADIRVGRSLHIRAAPLGSLAGDRFDLVMFHHSLEHIPDAADALRRARELLVPGGCCLVRVPVAGSRMWREYGTDWMALDAPRHLWLHTTQSMGLMAERSGLRLDRVEHDEDAMVHWASELYRRGLTLYDPERGMHRDPKRYFSDEEMGRFNRLCEEANARGDASTAAFYLRKP